MSPEYDVEMSEAGRTMDFHNLGIRQGLHLFVAMVLIFANEISDARDEGSVVSFSLSICGDGTL